MAQVMKGTVNVVLLDTGGATIVTARYKKVYYSGTTTDWRLAGDAAPDDPGGAVTINLAKGAQSGFDANYYHYYGDIITTYTYSLYVDVGAGEVLQASQEGVTLMGMDLVQYIQGNYDHTQASAAVHGATGSVVGTTDTQTLTNKTLTTPIIATLYQDAGKTKLMTFPNTLSDTVLTLNAIQTLTNKTLTTPIIASIYQDAGKTKLMTLPDTASDTLVALIAEQTLTNKTLTTPIIASIYQDAGKTKLMTLPAVASDTLAVDGDVPTVDEIVVGLASGTASSLSVLKYMYTNMMANPKTTDMLVYSGYFTTGTATPVGAVVPTKVLQLYINTTPTPKDVYISVGLTNADWIEIT